MKFMLIKTACGMLVVGVFGLSLAVADPQTQPTSHPATGPTTSVANITWDQASKHVGETVTVNGPVAGTHVSTAGTALILNVGKDYPDPSRFSVMINTDATHPASADTYSGKNITVTGKIELYRKVPEIKAGPADVTVEK